MLCVLRIIAPEIIFGSLNLTNQVGNAFSQLISAKLQIAGSRPYFAKVDCDKNTEENRISKKLPALKKEIVLENLSFSYHLANVFLLHSLFYKLLIHYSMFLPLHHNFDL